MPPTTGSIGANASKIPNGWRKSSQYDFPVDPRTIFSTWTLPGAASTGAMLYVPLEVTVWVLVVGSAPICSLCHVLMWRRAPPITSNGSPYSETVQLEEIATRSPPEVQSSVLA